MRDGIQIGEGLRSILEGVTIFIIKHIHLLMSYPPLFGYSSELLVFGSLEDAAAFKNINE